MNLKNNYFFAHLNKRIINNDFIITPSKIKLFEAKKFIFLILLMNFHKIFNRNYIIQKLV
jgi:hypothetical protein